MKLDLPFWYGPTRRAPGAAATQTGPPPTRENRFRYWPLRVFFACVLCVVSQERAFSQGSTPNIYSTLQTGGGPLTTSTQTFPVSLLPNNQLLLSFGFATQEQPVAGQFLDAATITLQGITGSPTAIFLTVDAGGVLWAPSSPGALPLNPADWAATPLSYRDTSQPWLFQVAYSFSVPVPSEFAGSTANLFLDLYDNGNTLNSLAWISTVPEPGSVCLFLAGLLLLRKRIARR